MNRMTRPPARRLLVPVNALRTRPRLLLSIGVGVLSFFALSHQIEQHAGSRFLVSWNLGAFLYLTLSGVMMFRSSPEQMHRRALDEDEGRWMILILVVVAAITVFFAIASQLAAVQALPESQRLQHVAMAGLTVLSSWAFTQVMFAIHYAHEFYLERLAHRPDPLVFPGSPNPHYLDFVYFSCVIGTSGQTADVSFHGSALRPIGLLHCVLAFFFNTALFALAINIAAGLFN
jgi:uncharacterized membrane protein